MAKEISGEQARGNYPPRLYAEGESNLESKLINHNIKMGELPAIREAIGIDAWGAMKGYPIGIVAKLSDSGVTWSGKLVHYLLCRQLKIHKKELWFLVGGQPIRFGLNEFRHITGLNTDLLPTEPFEPSVDYKAFFSELNVPNGEGPTFDELRAGLSKCRIWDLRQRKWLGLLILLCAGIYGLHNNSRIPFESAKRVFDDEAMKAYPWGRIAFKTLVDSVKMLRPEGTTYTVSGFVHVLQAWAYEYVTCFGELFGKKVYNDEVPLLQWGGKRTHQSFETTIAKEIKSFGQVRVINMVMKDDVRDLFHTWPDQSEDPAVDHLIQDIHEKKFSNGFWDVKGTDKKVQDKVPVESESPAKKLRVQKDGGEARDVDTQKKKKKKKKKNEGKGDNEEEDEEEDDEEDVEEDVSLRTVVDMINKLQSRLDSVDTSIKNLPSILEKVVGDRVEARMEARFRPMFTVFESRLGSFDNDLKQMKDQRRAEQDDQNVDDTKSPFLKTPEGPLKTRKGKYVDRPIVEKNIIVDDKGKGIDGKGDALAFLEVKCSGNTQSLGNRKSPASNKKNTTIKTINTRLRSKVGIDTEDKTGEDKTGEAKQADVTKRGGRGGRVGRGGREGRGGPSHVMKKLELVDDDNNDLDEDDDPENDEFEDITDHVFDAYNRLEPESDGDDEEHLRNKLIRDSDTPKEERARVFPHIGENGMTRIRNNYVPSIGIYDPFAPVDPAKLQKLTAYVAPYKNIRQRRATTEVEFLRVIITEKKLWPSQKYGWLQDKHINAYLRVLRKRSMQDPCPFHSKRIAFIDSYFAMNMVKDFEMFKIKPKMFKFKGTQYEQLVNGLNPDDQQTNLKWIEDVDHLFIIPQTGGNHWVALHVDLHKGHIDCYDSIMGRVTKPSQRTMLENCRSFTQMIPAMMNDLVPDTLRKPSVKQFTFRWKSANKVPQNTRVGDCGVYALKYVECLALGVTFDGLCDDNIQDIRVKMAADILDEEPNYLS